MYVEIVPNRNSRPAILLREGWREGKKVCKRTLANLTDWPARKVELLRRLLGSAGDTPHGSASHHPEIWADLTRTRLGPARSASAAVSSLPYAVISTTGIRGYWQRSAVTSSRPFIQGI